MDDAPRGMFCASWEGCFSLGAEGSYWAGSNVVGNRKVDFPDIYSPENYI